MGTINSILNKIEASKGKSKGWPNCFAYYIKGEEAKITLVKDFDRKSFRRLDPWGLAFVKELEAESGIKVRKITFVINDIKRQIYFESFLRRVSFLSFNNPHIKFKVIAKNEIKKLYTNNLLFNRPSLEVIEEEAKSRDDEDKPGRIEKDLQAFLFGKGFKQDIRTNERLAVFGNDFFKLKTKKLGIAREFPTGVFLEVKNENSRILSTNFVDVVTLNKHLELAVIEIKVNDSQLEVISQILDYALFFRSYLDKLLPVLKKNQIEVDKRKNIVCYVANNYFHERFNKIKEYYRTENKGYGFIIKQIVLGYTQII